MAKEEAPLDLEAIIKEKAETYKLKEDTLRKAVREELTALVARDIAKKVHAALGNGAGFLARRQGGEVAPPAPPNPVEPSALSCATSGRAAPDPVCLTGTPPCARMLEKDGRSVPCPHRAIPGDIYCGTHGGKMVLRPNSTLGIIGPGTYHAIGEMIGVSHRTVSRVLRGEVGVSIDMLTKIAKVVGIGREELLQYIENNLGS